MENLIFETGLMANSLLCREVFVVLEAVRTLRKLSCVNIGILGS